LEEQLNTKMKAQPLEWRQLMERGEIPDDEKDSEDNEEDAMELGEEGKVVEDQSEDSEWMTVCIR
jgi:hypothetical protein